MRQKTWKFLKRYSLALLFIEMLLGGSGLVIWGLVSATIEIATLGLAFLSFDVGLYMGLTINFSQDTAA